jgi:hypothetical protein
MECPAPRLVSIPSKARMNMITTMAMCAFWTSALAPMNLLAILSK